MLSFAWIGYYGSDDMSYSAGAVGWADSFPYVGQNHWELRTPLVGAIAVAYKIFGISEWTLVLPNVAFFVATLGFTFYFMRRYASPRAAILATLLFLTTPLFVIDATRVAADIAELLFIALSFWLFYLATQADSSDRNRLLLLSGLVLGGGWMVRETTAFFVIFYGLAFLFYPGVERKRYFFLGLGFVAIVALEWTYFWIMTGTPFHRIYVDLGTHLHVHTVDQGVLDTLGERAATAEGGIWGVIARTGNLAVNRYLDPIVAIFLNEEFGLLYYLIGAAVAVLLVWHLRKSDPLSRLVKLAAFAMVVWYFFFYFQVGIKLLPRYLAVSSYFGVILIAIWLDAVFEKSGRTVPMLLLAAFVASSVLCIYVDNRNPIFAERRLVELAAGSDRTIVTDPETARRAGFLLDLEGVRDRVVAREPAEGDLFFFNPVYTVQGLQTGDPEKQRERLRAYRPDPAWERLETIDPPRRLLGVALESLGISAFIPPEIFRRIDSPNPQVILYRVSAGS